MGEPLYRHGKYKHFNITYRIMTLREIRMNILKDVDKENTDKGHKVEIPQGYANAD